MFAQVREVLSSERGAYFSLDRKYRYTLWENWGSEPKILFIMLNPSIADEKIDDSTIRRCKGYAKQWGFGGVKIANLYALVSTDPKGLGKVRNAVGDENDEAIVELRDRVDKVIVAWGHCDEKKRRRAMQVIRLIGKPVYCLGIDRDGCPRHPLYLAKSLIPVVYKA